LFRVEIHFKTEHNSFFSSAYYFYILIIFNEKSAYSLQDFYSAEEQISDFEFPVLVTFFDTQNRLLLQNSSVNKKKAKNV